jgi:hypothetical protein
VKVNAEGDAVDIHEHAARAQFGFELLKNAARN